MTEEEKEIRFCELVNKVSILETLLTESKEERLELTTRITTLEVENNDLLAKLGGFSTASQIPNSQYGGIVYDIITLNADVSDLTKRIVHNSIDEMISV